MQKDKFTRLSSGWTFCKKQRVIHWPNVHSKINISVIKLTWQVMCSSTKYFIIGWWDSACLHALVSMSLVVGWMETEVQSKYWIYELKLPNSEAYVASIFQICKRMKHMTTLDGSHRHWNLGIASLTMLDRDAHTCICCECNILEIYR